MYPPGSQYLSSTAVEYEAFSSLTSQPSETAIATTTAFTPLVHLGAAVAAAMSSVISNLDAFPSSIRPSSTTSGMSSYPTDLPNDGPENTGECELLGQFAVIVQAAMGALALLALVYKRWRERPQRPIKIWAF